MTLLLWAIVVAACPEEIKALLLAPFRAARWLLCLPFRIVNAALLDLDDVIEILPARDPAWMVRLMNYRWHALAAVWATIILSLVLR